MPDQNHHRKKRDTSRKHQVILDNAIEVFTRKGYEAASMDDIAETAGVSKRTIYNHFQSKEKLFQEIVEGFLAGRDSIKHVEYSKTVPLEDQLKTFIEAELYLIKDPVNRGISRLLTSVFLMDTNFGKATRGQYSPHQDFIDWLNCAVRDGKLCMKSPQLAARIFYGLIEGCLTWAALMSDGESLNQIESVIGEMIFVFLCRYGARS